MDDLELVHLLNEHGLLKRKALEQLKPGEVHPIAYLVKNRLIRERRLREYVSRDLRMNQSILYKDRSVEVGGLTVPRYLVSGDFYGTVPLGNGKVVFILSDISGKGPAAGIITFFLARLIRQSINMQSVVPGSIMKTINHLSLDFFQDDQFATFTLAMLDVDTGTVEYSMAGAPPMLHYHYHDDYVEELDIRNLPIGIIPEADYRGRTVPLDKGDILLIYSDGAYEAENRKGEFYGLDRIKADLKSFAQYDPGTILRSIKRNVKRFTFLRGLNDDMTYVAIRRNINRSRRRRR